MIRRSGEDVSPPEHDEDLRELAAELAEEREA
jgi:hypothetical protein